LLLTALSPAPAAHAADSGWDQYGGDQGGQRFSAASQLTPKNVRRLRIAWTYSASNGQENPKSLRHASFENTPILGDGRLYLCSQFDSVSALDPGSGKLIWRYDAKPDRSLPYANNYVCRGVAFWRNSSLRSGLCASQVFIATIDRRLIALDAATGRPCPSFGAGGVIKLVPDAALSKREEEQNTSPPIVSRGLVIVGSSVEDNWRTDAPNGSVRAFDAATGAPRWSFDPIPRDVNGAQALGWNTKEAPTVGAANVWAPMSADDERGLVFLPTTSPGPDFFGGLRKGDNRYADSVVALHTDTGKVAWSFQITHHDVWDYDVSSQPTLGMVNYRGKPTPALLQATKQGLLFTLDRVTGNPVIPVVERKTPQGGVAGEALSPTQPFPIAPPPLIPTSVKPSEAFGLTPWDRKACRDAISRVRNEGIYTPPTAETGTLQIPGYSGGSNWGGLAFDTSRQIAVVNTTSIVDVIRLFPGEDLQKVRSENPSKIVSPQMGAPYGITSSWLLGPFGMPCNPPPWGRLTAIDMREGQVLWSVALGSTTDIFPFSDLVLGKTGTPNVGGPIVTASGLVFIGAAMDNYLRAFDVRTGAELWKGRLPSGGQATPMTYTWKGRQYVLIAAGGHAGLNTKRGDTVVAFALPD
jgi:quinoprotein glucose dehydrogenase